MTDSYLKLLNRLKEDKLLAEQERIRLMKAFEHEALSEGYDLVLGVDEVGRGPLCGPVVTACCVLDPSDELLFLNDSKKLSEKKREILSDEIKERAICYAFSQSSPETIDDINILQATKLAMKAAIKSCENELRERFGSGIRLMVLIDGNQSIEGLSLPQRTIIKGDGSSVSIAAASILAKVERDHMMLRYDSLYPEYGLAKNKGYGTREHMAAIMKYGPSPIHRRSFIGNILHDREAGRA